MFLEIRERGGGGFCNVYMGSGRAIYNDIAPKPRLFFVRGRKNPEGRGSFSAENEK